MKYTEERCSNPECGEMFTRAATSKRTLCVSCYHIYRNNLNAKYQQTKKRRPEMTSLQQYHRMLKGYLGIKS
jgi:protein-arginine kinase activator protein McsA